LLQQLRHHRQEKRLIELIRQDPDEDKKAEEEAIRKSKAIDTGVDGKYSMWKRDDVENADSMIRIMRDQLIMARAYAAIAESSNNPRLLRDLKVKIKENQKVLEDANVDSELPSRWISTPSLRYFHDDYGLEHFG
jgi:alpha-1,4-galacturonosyltransferase